MHWWRPATDGGRTSLLDLAAEMKLSLPTHVPARELLIFLGVTFFVQVIEGTKILTAFEFGAFLFICADAFNAAGGLIYPSGAYIFFFSLLSVGVGGYVKTLFGEPLDSNVTNAQRSMLAYVACAGSLWVASKLNRQMRAKRPWLMRYQTDYRIRQVALGSALFGQYGWLIIPYSVITTFEQVNNFLPLAVLLLVYARTRQTGGRQSFTLLAFVVWLYSTVTWGILAFSKQGMFVPSVVWAIGALAAGYRASLKQVLILAAAASLAAAILTPVSQLGRNYQQDPHANQIAWSLLSHPLDTRHRYLEAQAASLATGTTIHWFNGAEGLLDRLAMFPIDDALMNVTDQGHELGFAPIESRIYNMVPRYLLRGDKPTLHWGNSYAHEIGLLGVDDFTTGVSFSPVADAYHCLRWWGLAVCCPLFLVMFVVSDSLTGSTRQTIWGTLYIILFAHSAPEGMLNTMFAAPTTYAFGIAAAAMLATYFLPYVGGLLLPVTRPVSAFVQQQPWRANRPLVKPSMARTIENNI